MGCRNDEQCCKSDSTSPSQHQMNDGFALWPLVALSGHRLFFGISGDVFGRSWGHAWSFGDHFGNLWEVILGTLGVFGGFFRQFGGRGRSKLAALTFRAQSGPKMEPKWSNNRLKNRLIFECVFDRCFH